MKLLDCTLRDGGFHTNWFFGDKFIEDYVRILNHLSIENIEIGYINPPNKISFGPFYHLQPTVVESLVAQVSEFSNIWVMYDVKNYTSDPEFAERLKSIKAVVHGVRLTVDPLSADLTPLRELLTLILAADLKVSINFMYSHKILDCPSCLDGFAALAQEYTVDYVSIVDSYGCIFPEQLRFLTELMQKNFPKCGIGFHGHDNLGLASANMMVAKEQSLDVVDCTFAGFGRGAGNLQTEIAVVLARPSPVSYTVIHTVSEIDMLMAPFKNKHSWGTNAPYAFAASKRLPQTLVMSLIELKRFSESDIIEIIQKDEPISIEKKEGFGNEQAPISVKDIQGASAFCLSGNELKTTKWQLTEFVGRCEELFVCGANALDIFLEHLDIFSQFEQTTFIWTETEKRQLQKYIEILPQDNLEILNPFDQCEYSLASPVEAAVKKGLQKNIRNFIMCGFDGGSGRLLFSETERLIDLFKENKCFFFTVTDTQYSMRFVY